MSRSQLTEAQQIAHIGSWEWDIGTNTVSWSQELYRIFGLTPQEFCATYEDYVRHSRLRLRTAVKVEMA